MWSGGESQINLVPGGRSHRRVAGGIQAVGTGRVKHAQAGAAVGSNALRTHKCLQDISLVRRYRDVLKYPKVFLIPAHGKVHAQTSRALVCRGIKEIKVEIGSNVLTPIQPGIQRNLLEITIEYKIVAGYSIVRRDDSQPLKVLPNVLRFLPLPMGEQIIKIRFGRRKRERGGVDHRPDPNLVSGVSVTFGA